MPGGALPVGCGVVVVAVVAAVEVAAECTDWPWTCVGGVAVFTVGSDSTAIVVMGVTLSVCARRCDCVVVAVGCVAVAVGIVVVLFEPPIFATMATPTPATTRKVTRASTVLRCRCRFPGAVGVSSL